MRVVVTGFGEIGRGEAGYSSYDAPNPSWEAVRGLAGAWQLGEHHQLHTEQIPVDYHWVLDQVRRIVMIVMIMMIMMMDQVMMLKRMMIMMKIIMRCQ